MSSYLKAPLRNLAKECDTIEEVLGRAASPSHIPTGQTLNNLRESVQKRCLDHVKVRGDESDLLLRELQNLRKTHQITRRERAERPDKSPKKDPDSKIKLKKVKKREPDAHMPPAVGAHGLARQDGVDVHKDPSSSASSPISQPPPSASGTGNADATTPGSMSDDPPHQPAPVAAIPKMQTFGPDPSTFDDPTIYDIREVTPGMTEEEIKAIYCVAEYPRSDLHDKTPGTPPDKDFSNAKPPTQVNASVFANYVEPYIRPLTEEDLAFLKERGDRVTPFTMPRRGSRHYKEIWAQDDNAMHLDNPNDSRLPANEPRGSADDITDENLATDMVSAGPLMSRLLCLLRNSGRGDTNGTAGNPDAMDIDEGAGAGPPADTTNTHSLPAAAQLSESVQSSWKAPVAPPPRTDYASLEERMAMEVRNIGFVAEADADRARYDDHYDDEVAARLRILQEELRKQSIKNGARKQRLLELTNDRLAQQEYNGIADDLDNQLNQAYLKRNRNIGKGKKQVKRPGGAGGGSHAVGSGNTGISRPGVGEPIRQLMERRSTWIKTVGPIMDFGKSSLPKETIFPKELMATLENKEQDNWTNEEEE